MQDTPKPILRLALPDPLMMALVAIAACSFSDLLHVGAGYRTSGASMHGLWAFPSAACLGTALVNALPFAHAQDPSRALRHALLTYVVISVLSCCLFVLHTKASAVEIVHSLPTVPMLYVGMLDSAPLEFAAFGLGFSVLCVVAALNRWPSPPRTGSMRARAGWIGAASAIFLILTAHLT